MSKEISKLMSLVLRHDPGRLGLTLDANGWTAIEPLIKRIRGAGYPAFDRPTLDAVVKNNDKQRFTVSDDGQSIRAAQGHSIQIDLGLQPSRPPALLYHGTAAGFIESIREQGLIPGRRQHVHLSMDRDTAVKVGGRHGSPVVLTVEAGKMFDVGISFYQAENGVWLTDLVPVEYLGFALAPED